MIDGKNFFDQQEKIISEHMIVFETLKQVKETIM